MPLHRNLCTGAPSLVGSGEDCLREHPMAAFQAGRAHPVPLIFGTNDSEGSLFRGRVDVIPRTPARIQALFRQAPEPSPAALHAV